MLKHMTDDKTSRPAATSEQGFSTKSVHAGEVRQKHGDAITDAIFCASTFTFTDTQSVIDFIEEGQPREEYAERSGERLW